MKTLKKMLVSFGFIVLVTNKVWANNNAFEFSVKPIADNVYSIISPSYGRPSPENKGWNSNSHFVVTEEGVLVFDTGSSTNIGQGLLNAIKSVTKLPVRWVVNSHSHADHWLGNAAFVEAGAEIMSTAASIATMKQDGPADIKAFNRMTDGATVATQLAYPTLLLKHGEKRTLGGVDIEFVFSNDAHSPGDALIWLPKQRVILGGDVLNSDWMPIMTHHGNTPNLIETLNRVVTLSPVTVLPGHGKPTTVKSVIRDAELLTAVWTRVKTARDKGKKLEDILSHLVTELAAKYRSQYQDFDSSSEYLVTMIYQEQQSLE